MLGNEVNLLQLEYFFKSTNSKGRAACFRFLKKYLSSLGSPSSFKCFYESSLLNFFLILVRGACFRSSKIELISQVLLMTRFLVEEYFLWLMRGNFLKLVIFFYVSTLCILNPSLLCL